MTHNYAKDLKYLIALKDTSPTYLGLLGPLKRREKLFSEFLEHTSGFGGEIFEILHCPAGLNLGAAPLEIAISINSEILTVIRDEEPMPLKDKKGGIHDVIGGEIKT